MARKKKRSAKQLANDRRLGRMAKARAKKKRGGRRKKTVRKKNTHRKIARKKNVHATRRRLAKSHLWRVFRCRGKSVFWIFMDTKGKWNWTKDTGKAILFATKGAAGNVAKGIAKKSGYAPYQLGAAPRDMSAATVASQCKAGK